jgi:hypothetical protein
LLGSFLHIIFNRRRAQPDPCTLRDLQRCRHMTTAGDHWPGTTTSVKCTIKCAMSTRPSRTAGSPVYLAVKPHRTFIPHACVPPVRSLGCIFTSPYAFRKCPLSRTQMPAMRHDSHARAGFEYSTANPDAPGLAFNPSPHHGSLSPHISSSSSSSPSSAFARHLFCV